MHPFESRDDQLTRRQVVLAIGGAGVAAMLAGCSDSDSDEPGANPSPEGSAAVPTQPSDNIKVLVVYFSRAGENYFYGGRRDLDVGNTQVLATMIDDRIECDVYQIEAEQPYPESYDETVDRNVDEQDADARPAIARPLPDVDSYDTVLLGSPVWNVRAPMIMSTFIEGIDLTGKTVLPFVTYAVSGMGTVEDDYRSTLPGADVRAGLAVRGETVADAGAQLDDWLRKSRLI